MRYTVRKFTAVLEITLTTRNKHSGGLLQRIFVPQVAAFFQLNWLTIHLSRGMLRFVKRAEAEAALLCGSKQSLRRVNATCVPLAANTEHLPTRVVSGCRAL